MKRGLLFSLLICFSFGAFAQSYPPEWVKYTSGGYLADIQSDRNTRNLSDAEFRNYLLNLARTNLAKQVRMHIEEVADMKKIAVDGRTSIVYSSDTRFSTDLDLKLVETKTSYDSRSEEHYAIAYIDKDAARNYYKNALMIAANKIGNSIELARSYIAAGFKTKARQELENTSEFFVPVDESLFWMNIFGTPQDELNAWQGRFNAAEQNIKRMLADLKHGMVIYLSCTADIFGRAYPTLQNELKGILATDGCSFTDNPADADWAITVTCVAREYSNVKIGNSSSYFSYVDARIVIDKVVTSQRIYEDEISVKGGHTFGYDEAAKAGYKEIKQQLGKIIKENIK